MSSWSRRLDTLPRLGLVREPTPLVVAPRLSAAVGGPQILLKRDDLLPVAFGGNKVRSLDLILGEALRQDADTVVTGAGPLSNHVRATAGVAAMAGLRCLAVYWGPHPPRVEGNHLLTKIFGAEIRFTNDADRASCERGIEAAVAEVMARGGKPYGIPRGGACAVGTLAHVLAVRETLNQCATLGVMPQVIVMAVGGAATLAGWLLGSALFCARWRLESITVSRPAAEAAALARTLAVAAAAKIDSPSSLESVEIHIDDGFLGKGYGIPSPQGQAAISTVARREGVLLDPTYTGKAMAGYLELLSRGRFAGIDTVLFLHTGGAPSLFTAAVEAML